MNNHSLGWREQAKFSLASRQRRREVWRNVGIIAGIVAAYAIVGTIDYQTELRAEIHAQEESNRALTATLASCLNGEARFTHPGPHRDGHATTAVVCQKAFEVKL